MSLEIKIGADIGDVDKAINKVGASLNGLKAPTVNAQNTLTSFSGVVRDLPFGFIAIQNNLPMVVDSFGQLSKQAGGALPALKALGGSLMGPAGIAFAFGAVTAGVTALIQKYGSLGNAIDAIFSKNGELVKAQQDYNKELAKSVGGTQTEVAEINILTKTLANLNAPMKDRQAAYVELKKISPDIVAGVANENMLTAANTKIILANAEARKQNLYLKAQESAISAVLNKNAEAMMKLEIERESLVTKLAKAEDDYAKKKKITFDATKTFGGALDFEAMRLESARKAYADNVLEYNKLIKVNDEYTAKLSPNITKTAELDLNTKKLNDSLKEQTKIIETIDPAKSAGLVGTINLLKKDTKVKLFDNIIDGSKHIVDVMMSFDMQQFINKFEKAQIAINNIFFNPLQQLFDTFITTGKLTFKEFTKSILSAISQIVSKIIASKIISLISNILLPGSGAFVSLGLKSASTSALGDFLNMSGGSANFSGIQGGSMGMSGSVNLTLRGTDLVGAINRTNSQISRVG